MAGHFLSSLAAACRTAFVKACLELPPVLIELSSRYTISDLEDDFEQFRVWTRNLGVFAKDEASLDSRLREAPEVQATIANILERIRTNLYDCR